MQYRTFEIPLRDKTEGFTLRYSFDDIGLNKSDFHFFGHIDAYGINIPPKKDIIDGLYSADADKVTYTHIVTPSEGIEYTYTRYITSTADIPSDIVLKLVSLPDVKEVETTLYHMSHILKSALSKDAYIDDIIDAIRSM